MHARYKVFAAILLVIIVSVLLFDHNKSTRATSLQHHFHRYFLSHSTVVVPPPESKMYAYVLYATSEDYLCNSIVNAQRLTTLNVRETADIVVLYNKAWDNAEFSGVENKFRKLKALQVQDLLISVLCSFLGYQWACEFLSHVQDLA